jgi:hypothetical protein
VYTVFLIDMASRRVQILGSNHGERNQQGLENRLISGPPPIDMTSRVRRRSRLGGLLNFYQRAA